MSRPMLGDMVGDLSQDLSSVGRDFRRGQVRSGWPKIYKLVAEQMDAALDVDLVDLLAEIWAKQVDIDLDLEGGAEDIEISGTVTLGHHSITVTLDPDLTLTIDGIASGRIGIALTFDLSVKGAVLTVRENALDEVELGPIGIKGYVECDGNRLPIGVPIADFNAFGKHKLHPPLGFRRKEKRRRDD